MTSAPPTSAKNWTPKANWATTACEKWTIPICIINSATYITTNIFHHHTQKKYPQHAK